jgi:hypothetical protein
LLIHIPQDFWGTEQLAVPDPSSLSEGVAPLIATRRQQQQIDKPIIMAESVEYKVLIYHTADLELAVKESLTPLGAQLVSAQIITPEQYAKIRNPHQPINERGADLVGYVQNKVRQDPRYYYAFIGTLKSAYGDILTKLEETRLTLASERQPVIPQHPPREGTYGVPAQGSCLNN